MSCTTDVCSDGECVGTPIVPGEASNLVLLDRTTLFWGYVPGNPPEGYDVARGVLNGSPPGSGPSDACIAPHISATTTTDVATPAPGSVFWYLVRSRNACVSGTYGAASDGTPRSVSACPF
jgi:hypothetical protein